MLSDDYKGYFFLTGFGNCYEINENTNHVETSEMGVNEPICKSCAEVEAKLFWNTSIKERWIAYKNASSRSWKREESWRKRKKSYMSNWTTS